jgi:3'-phosphoadenosine 5'-phosphosulfate sulfotransferase (PAPS reductase)/FAD synthetase
VKRDFHVVSFSGGKDSTAMLLKMIELNYKIDRIIFCDTYMEFPDMYVHIEKVNNYIKQFGYSITYLKSKKSFEYYMFEYTKQRGKNKGEKGYGWANGLK